MKISFHSQALDKLALEALIVPLAVGGASKMPAELQSKIPQTAFASFQGKIGQHVAIFPNQGVLERIILVGLGDTQSDIALTERLRRSVAFGTRESLKLSASKIGIYLPETNETVLYESALMPILAAYRYEKHRSKKEDHKELEHLVLIGDKKLAKTRSILEWVAIIADSVRIARDLVNAPSNIMTPKRLAQAARTMMSGIKHCTIATWGLPELMRKKFGALLAVAQGSDEEPQLITLQYQPPAAKKTVVFVGKGVTFDTGGINLKPERGIEGMQMDMAGGAIVLTAVTAIAKLKLPIRVIAIVPATENMPSGAALKPGDIVTTLAGLTIEVANTDAEGRMILADALTYAADFKPDQIIDCATLTGAALVALGEEQAALIGNNSTFVDQIIKAGTVTGEELCRLPLTDDYREHVKSEIADVKNVGRKSNAGVISGAAFLEKFVPKDLPWAHIDLAGPAIRSYPRSYEPKGGTGWGVRLLIEYIHSCISEA
ncbi:leucyl aminopeptidase [Candidatus Berkelbacteria bacterium]|nr:leucyl aminopeptidase [Candidatus Berkelbacteria bacterium]